MKFRLTDVRAITALCLLLCGAAVIAEPDEDALGKLQGYPIGGPPTWYATPYRVGAWSAMDQVGVPVRAVKRGTDVLPCRTPPRHPSSAIAGATSTTRSTTTWSDGGSPAC